MKDGGTRAPDSGRIVGKPEVTILLVPTSGWPVNRPQSESTIRLQVPVAVLSDGFVKGEIHAAISVGGRPSP